MSHSGERPALDLARVLLMHRELASRLALQAILQAGGYTVDVASTPAEAITLLDSSQYELVLSDSDAGEREGRSVLAYARVKAYHPATALVTSYDDGEQQQRKAGHQVSIYTENLPGLLADVAELIGVRASRRHRPLRQAV